MKILFIDIETAPKVALVWRFFKENISPKQVKEHGHIMSFAAKWLGSDEIIYEENRTDKDRRIVEKMVHLLNEADAVVAHNGSAFDIKEIRARALVNGLKPPSPVKVIDTYRIARKEFRFPSYSLEYLTTVLNCSHKKGGHQKFPGFELWLECLRKNEDAWKELRDYNIIDVLALEELYHKLKPWATLHPNVTVDSTSDEAACPKCNSTDVQWRGYSYTNSYKYHRFQCNSCGGWGRTRYNLLPKKENSLVSDK